jgi:TonB family protein
MPPTAKDLDAATSNAQTDSNVSGKVQPVAMEVPVTVNGARTVAGSDKREPFSETTQTVLVFGHGAVIRLASSVTPGQLLFLTNEKTKKEVVCQVLKSKNYSNVSGYVELEFTEPVSGFWGVRFAESAPKPASAPVAVATKVPGPAIPAPTTTAPKAPAPAATIAPVAPVVPSASVLPKVPAMAPIPVSGTVNASAPVTEVKPPIPVVPKAPVVPQTPANIAANDALKRESARLQEQLSTMLVQAQGTMTPPAPKHASESPSKVIDITRSQGPAKTDAPVNTGTSRAGLDADEVKIPSWLEPLARNAATPAQNEIAAEEDEEVEFEVQDVSAPTTSQEIAAAAPVVAEPELPESEFLAQEQPVKKGGNKMMLVGAVAAGLLLLIAGGTWYARQSSNKSSDVSVASNVAPPSASVPAASATPIAAKSGSETSSPSAGNFNSAPVPASSSATPPANSQPATPSVQPLKNASEKNTSAELSAYKKLAEPQPQPVQPAPKRPSLGTVTLAAPAAARRTGGNAPGEADLAPSLSGNVAASGDALGGGLGGSTSKPVAPAVPLPVGGDVRQAKLLASTPPLYPALAKTQHIEGAVRVDALVDESGHVTTVKIVSGPTLLQQAAIDAIRKWKYQPATLDGKAVPMHLTVTLQFKLQ